MINYEDLVMEEVDKGQDILDVATASMQRAAEAEADRDKYRDLLLSFTNRLDPLGERTERYMLFDACEALGIPVPSGDE